MSEPAQQTASRGDAEKFFSQGYSERSTPAGSLKPLTLGAPVYCVDWALDVAQPAENPGGDGRP